MPRTDRESSSYTWSHGWWPEPPIGRTELLHRIEPLLLQIRRVDEVVTRLARGQGRVADLLGLEQVLTEPFSIKASGTQSLTLAQPPNVRAALSSLSRELHLEVYAVDRQYPSYLLCRLSTAWDSPDTILEELHVSTIRNEFLADSRFVVLMRSGCSRTFLRVSPFREKLKSHLTGTRHEAPDEVLCDDILDAVSTLVLGAAWYEDQRLPFLVADVFGLRCFRSALEVVGFVLGSDLYQVTAGLQDYSGHVAGFFEHVYKNRSLAELLKRMRRRSAGNVADLEVEAQESFRKLNRAFSAFLSTTDAIRDLENRELYKIVLGSLGNLPEVAQSEYRGAAMEQAIETIEASSKACLDRLSPSSDEDRE